MSNNSKKLKPSKATVKEAVQKRITPSDHSSIIPGIDMNELKHSLDLLKYALDYSEAIVDTVKTPLVVLNKKLQVLTANRSFYDTFHLNAQETENSLIYELNNGAWNIPKLKTLLEKILPNNTFFENYEVEIEHPRIGRRVMLLSGRRTYRQVNNTEAILFGFEDITERRQLEKQKDDFISIVSHELKTPLTVMKLYAHSLEKHFEQNKDKKGSYYLSKIINHMGILTQLMASFVNVYKIQNGKLVLHKELFKVDELISSIVSDFQFSNKSHIVENAGQSKALAFGDRDRIGQVLVNLISNAIKYSPNADRVIVAAEKKAGKVIISVKDFGLGIPPDEQTKIFDRFFRVKAKREQKISGLGLGLYISHEIVTQHKGKIWVESEEGKGSTFYFSLPIK